MQSIIEYEQKHHADIIAANTEEKQNNKLNVFDIIKKATFSDGNGVIITTSGQSDSVLKDLLSKKWNYSIDSYVENQGRSEIIE
jgi:hypothetical protein